MINLQKTSIDEHSTVRVWAKLDDAFRILTKKLGLEMNKLRSAPKLEEDVFEIPYDCEGKLVKEGEKKMLLDFRQGSKVKICHPDSQYFGLVGEIAFKYEDHYTLKLVPKTKAHYYALGSWWVDAARRGVLNQFSFVNEKPKFVERERAKEEVEIEEEEEVLQLVVGNTHKEEGEHHRWNCFVRSGEKHKKEKIKSVSFRLHPTFSPRDVLVEKAPFEIERVGWGVFNIEIQVTLTNGKQKQLAHCLSFSGNGVEQTINLTN